MRTRNAVLLFFILAAAAMGVLKLTEPEPRKEMTPAPSVSVSVSEEKKVETEIKEEKEVKKVKKVVKRDAEGWLPYMTVGRNPYAPHRTPEKDRKILEKQGYTTEEIEEYFELSEKGKGSHRAFLKGEKFFWVSFGDASIIEKLLAVWNVPVPGTLYQLKSGRNVVVLDECENLSEVSSRSVKEEIVVLPPVVIEAEGQQVVEEPLPVALPVVVPPLALVVPPVVEEKEVNCLNSRLTKWDPNLFAGHEREPRHNGNSMEATDFSVALYCLWQAEDPNVIHGLGLNFKGSWFQGRVNHGAGKFTGYLLAGGPAYKRVMKDKWDMEIRLLVGVFDEKFRQGGYRNHRDNWVVGPSFIFNDYERRAKGHKWFHETQWYVELLFPFASDLSQSWEGKPLAGDPDNLNVRFFIGFREWLYHNKWAEPYFSAGFFLEDPLAMSATLRFGLATPNRVLGFGIGPDFDLKNGGTVLGWGPWLDITTGLRDLRVGYRASQTIDVADIGGGVTVSPGGFIMVPFEENSPIISDQNNVVGSPDRSLR